MIRQIIRKEIFESLKGGYLILIWLVIFLLFIFSSSVFIKESLNSSHYQQNIENYNNEILSVDPLFKKRMEYFVVNVLKKDLTLFEDRLKNTLYDVAKAEQKIVKPISNLSFISSENNNIPDGIQTNLFQKSIPQSFRIEDISNGDTDGLDWSKIVWFVLSFIALCLSYNSFSGEKEQGTLKLILSNSISRYDFAIGKFLGKFIILFIPLVLGIVISLIIINFSPIIHFVIADYLKVLIYLVASGLFVFLSLGLFTMISVITRRSSVSLSIGLIVWSLFSIIIPNLTWVLSRKLIPVTPLTKVYSMEEQRVKNSIPIDLGYAWSDSWFRDGHPPVKGVYDRQSRVQLKSEIHNEIWNDYTNKLFSQVNTAIILSKISPFSVYKFLCQRVANSEYYGYQNFYTQVNNYRIIFEEFIKEKDYNDKSSYHLIWNGEKSKHFMSAKTVNIDEIPKFNYKSSSVLEILKESISDILLLIAWTITIIGFVFIRFNKYDVR